jgi:hypothetical protein
MLRLIRFLLQSPTNPFPFRDNYLLQSTAQICQSLKPVGPTAYLAAGCV